MTTGVTRLPARLSPLAERLDKLCELCVFIMEAFEGIEQQFTYSVVGHSGSGPEALRLIAWGKPPTSAKEKLKLVEELRTHAQYCNPGDATLDGTRLAIDDCLSKEADEVTCTCPCPCTYPWDCICTCTALEGGRRGPSTPTRGDTPGLYHLLCACSDVPVSP